MNIRAAYSNLSDGFVRKKHVGNILSGCDGRRDSAAPGVAVGKPGNTAKDGFDADNCRADIHVTAGTIFQGSHLPLRLWFRAMWWMTNQKGGVSAMGLQGLLGLGSYKTAWACLHKLRRVMVRAGREQLSGKVEIDETVIGGERCGAHGWHGDEKKAIVVVAAEVRGEGIGRIRLRRIPDAKFASLNKFIQEKIAPGSEIVTDGHKGYLEVAGLGYRHTPTVLKKDRELTKMVLGRAHRVASLLKRWLLGTHQGRVSREQLEHYLEEFAFRFNRRHSNHRGMLFYRLAQQAVASEVWSCEDLRKCA